MHSPTAVLLLLAAKSTSASEMLKSWPLFLNSGPRTDFYSSPGFTAEKWGSNLIDTSGEPGEDRILNVQGNNRLYAVEDINVRDWPEVRFHKFDILNKEITFTVDLSNVACGCNAAIYLVASNRLS